MIEVVETFSKPEIKEVATDIGALKSAYGFVGSLVSIDGFGFEWNTILRKHMDIKWPYSLYSYTRKEEGWRMNNGKRRKRRRPWLWDLGPLKEEENKKKTKKTVAAFVALGFKLGVLDFV